MNVKGGPIIGGGPVFGDAVVATWTDAGTVKATPAEDIPVYGRGSAGVRLTKLGDGQRVVRRELRIDRGRVGEQAPRGGEV